MTVSIFLRRLIEHPQNVAMQLMAEELELTVDLDGFDRCMEQQKHQSRKARKVGTGAKLKFEAEATSQLSRQSIDVTDDHYK